MATKTDLRQYWQQSPDRQIRQLQTFQALDNANVEQLAYIRENRLVEHKGKLVRAFDYPCKCTESDPYECGAGRFPHKEYAEQYCKCRCHAYEPA